MANRLFLHVPAFEELDYRQRLLADPATMAYNQGCALDFPGYHRDTGCIDFPREDWESWYAYFIGREPERLYAYIARREDGAFLGEVNLHLGGESGVYEMGVVLEAKYRGMGCGEEALALLLGHAFDSLGAAAVRNTFEPDRQAALRAHLACGFRELGRDGDLIELGITREEYGKRKRERLHVY